MSSEQLQQAQAQQEATDPNYRYAPHVAEVFEDKNKLFLKVFLLNADVNRANWGIKKEYIPKHVDKFVGRPFILTADRNHPKYEDVKIDYNNIQGTIGQLLQHQERYRIGTIRKVEPVLSAASDSWAAYVEVTDPTAISAFKAGYIPKYVSPTIFRLNPAEPPEVTTDYEPLHLAAVDFPAYGVNKAGIRGSCSGDLVTCSNALASASVPIEDCGFCIKGTLEGFTNVYSSLVTNPVNQASVNLSVNSTNNAESQQPTQQPQTQQSQQQPSSVPAVEVPTTTTPLQPKPEGAPFEVPKKVEAVKVEEVKPAEGNRPGQVGSSNESNKSNSSNSANKDEVATLRATVEALLSQVNELKSFRENSEKTEAEKKIAAKRGKIESFIPENYAHSNKEERTKAVEYLMRFDDGPELDYIMQKFVSPVTMKEQQQKEAIKQGSISNITTRAAAGKRLTDYAAASPNDNNSQQAAVAQAATTNFDIKRFQRIVSMSDIVGNSAYGGGAF